MEGQKINPDEFQCEVCKGIFKKDWSQAEALEELFTNFGKVNLDDCIIVCDDCYTKLMEE
jgi:hypothetical protein